MRRKKRKLSCTVVNHKMPASAFHPGFEIPKDIAAKLFPDQRISILKFLQHPFPIISTGTLVDISVAAFFSKAEPDVVSSPDQIVKIPTPSIETITALGKACKSEDTDFRSIVCPHTPSGARKHLPIWIITYWIEVVEICTNW
jgi:hypothetical protein